MWKTLQKINKNLKNLIVAIPVLMIAGYFTQQVLVKKYGRKAFQSRLAPRFPALSTLGVLGIVFIAMAYIIQVQSAAWYVKFADTLFGEAAEDVRPEPVKEAGVQNPARPMLSVKS